MNEYRAETLGGIEGYGITRTERPAAVGQIAANQNLGLGAAIGQIEQRGQEILYAQCVAIIRTAMLDVDAKSGPELGLGPVKY